MAAGLPLGIIRRWWWLVLLGGALGVFAALIAVRTVAPTYRATSTLFVIPPGEASLNQSFTRTYAQMAVAPVVLEQVRELLALGSSVRLDGSLTARHVPDTQLVEVVAQHADASVARDIANGAVHVFTEQQSMLQPVGPAGPAVRIGQLAVTPDQPIGPRPLPAVLLGALIGILVGLGVSVLLDMPRPIPAPVDVSARRPEPDTLEPAPARIPPERIQARDALRGAVVVVLAASVLLVSFAAGPVLRGSANQLEALGAQRAPQPAPAAATTRSSGEIAAAPSAGSGPAPTAIPEVTAAAVSSPTEPIPVATDLPVGASSAFPSPPAAPAAQGAEIAGATSAASPEGGPTLAPPTAGPAPAVAPPAAAAPAVPAPRVLFEDRFGDGPQLWPNDPQGSARYEGSAYRLLAREPGQFVAVAAPFRQPLRDAIVTASFTKVGGPPGGVYGLFVRDSGPAPRDGANQVGNFYVLGVDDRGQYGVWRREGSRWVDIVPLTSSEAVRPGGATNELTAHALDDRLSLTVNGVEVATVLGTEPRPGGLGVYIAGDLNEVQLNRFEVQPATASAGAAPAALTREAEVAGAVDVRAVETRSGTTRAPAGFTAAFLREAPTTSAPALAALPNGTGLEVLSDSATGDGFTWLRVRTGDGALGWMVSTAVAI